MADYFRLKFSFEGVPELSRWLLMKNSKLGNLKKPLSASANLILKDIEQNFITEGGLVGGWKALEKSTVKDRERAGFGGEHMILQRTGALRKSFYSSVSEKRALITSRSPYFMYHQSRGDRNVLPRRAMLVLTQRTRENIVQEFNSYLRGK